jgi:hypothetical protein
MGNSPSLIVMLTRNDLTVKSAVEVFEESKDTAAEFWGFKEDGIPFAEMTRLVRWMKDAKKKTFLEVVAYTEEECLQGAKMGLECGFDYLMGTMFFPSILKLVQNEPVKYMPFVGRIYGRPSILEGTTAEMVAEAEKILTMGADGFDLLAYRHPENPGQLATDFVKAVKAPVVIAGSIDSFERLDEVKSINPWAFTIGSAFFDKRFGPEPGFRDQIETVLDYMKK